MVATLGNEFASTKKQDNATPLFDIDKVKIKDVFIGPDSPIPMFNIIVGITTDPNHDDEGDIYYIRILSNGKIIRLFKETKRMFPIKMTPLNHYLETHPSMEREVPYATIIIVKESLDAGVISLHGFANVK